MRGNRNRMGRLYDINELSVFNSIGNHWFTASSTKVGLMVNVVEYSKIEELMRANAPSIIGVYSSDLEPIASYIHSDIPEEYYDTFFNRMPIKQSIDNYITFKQHMLAANVNNNKYFIYVPANNKWYNPRYEEINSTVNKTGPFISIRVLSENGELLYTYNHPDLEKSSDYPNIEHSFGQIVSAAIEGALLAGNAELLSNLL